MTINSDSSTLDSIDASVRLIARLLLKQVLLDSTNKEKVELLVELGMESKQISELAGLPMTTVSPIVSKAKKLS